MDGLSSTAGKTIIRENLSDLFPQVGLFAEEEHFWSVVYHFVSPSSAPTPF